MKASFQQNKMFWAEIRSWPKLKFGEFSAILLHITIFFHCLSIIRVPLPDNTISLKEICDNVTYYYLGGES